MPFESLRVKQLTLFLIQSLNSFPRQSQMSSMNSVYQNDRFFYHLFIVLSFIFQCCKEGGPVYG